MGSFVDQAALPPLPSMQKAHSPPYNDSLRANRVFGEKKTITATQRTRATGSTSPLRTSHTIDPRPERLPLLCALVGRWLLLLMFLFHAFTAVSYYNNIDAACFTYKPTYIRSLCIVHTVIRIC